MKKIFRSTLIYVFVLQVILLFTACSKTDTMTAFVEGIIELEGEKINDNEPLISIREIASKQAAKTIQITKGNIEPALQEARSYKHAIIMIGKHTIVKITDFNDCKKSTSWGTSMPYGKGYIQKNGLNSTSDYLNNIIGVPDKQARTLFLFN
jgi:predicted DNA-binding protein (UPF0251 family)